MEAWSIKKKMGVGIYEKMRKGPFGNPFSYHVFLPKSCFGNEALDNEALNFISKM